VDRVIESVELLATQPNAGRRLPELNDDRFREWVIGSYRLIYSSADQRLCVLAVIHGARELPYDAILRR
jgi:plasmid stabilization system protein ParE